MGIFRFKFWPLWIATVFMAAMVLFSTTPIIWEWSGRQSETYPELFFLFFGVPLALWLWTASVFVAIKGYHILSFRPLYWRLYGVGIIVGVFSIALFCLWLAVYLEIAGTLAFFFNWISFIVIAAGGVRAMWIEFKPEPPPPPRFIAGVVGVLAYWIYAVTGAVTVAAV